jgi:hypothetical protein
LGFLAREEHCITVDHCGHTLGHFYISSFQETQRKTCSICLSTSCMSNFKQIVIDFLVSKLPVIYHPLLSSYLALSKYIGKNNTTHDICCKSNIHLKYRLTLFVKNRKMGMTYVFSLQNLNIIILYYAYK